MLVWKTCTLNKYIGLQQKEKFLNPFIVWNRLIYTLNFYSTDIETVCLWFGLRKICKKTQSFLTIFPSLLTLERRCSLILDDSTEFYIVQSIVTDNNSLFRDGKTTGSIPFYVFLRGHDTNFLSLFSY